MQTKYFLSLCFVFVVTLLTSQVNPPLGELYGDQVIARIDLTINPDSLAWIYDEENLESEHYFQVEFKFDNGFISESLSNVGFRLRGNIAGARKADKKSFKLSFNTYESGRKFLGAEKLNLNSIISDPTISRPKFCSELGRFMDIPIVRTGHVSLFINGIFYGVYLNVEQIDEEFIQSRFQNKSGNLFKCLYPADLNYIGSSINAYNNKYDLKTNEHIDDYSDLAEFIDVLNNTPIDQLECKLEQVLNVDNYLKIMAFDVLTGNWDGYLWNSNNFYLYHNLETDLFEFIGYDMDLTYGIDWVNIDWTQRDIYTWSNSEEDRPLYERIMQVKKYKDRYSYYLNETIKNYFNEELFDHVDATRDQLYDLVSMDTFYLRPGLSIVEFYESFDQVPAGSSSDYGIKDYISKRSATVLDQLQSTAIDPIITLVKNTHPLVNQKMLVTAKVEHSEIESVLLCYNYENDSNQICVLMKDDGIGFDAIANDQIYSAESEELLDAGTISYFIQAIGENPDQNALAPTCGYYEAYITSNKPNLAINEIMASNESTFADGKGEYDDWIELHNYGFDPIYIGDKYLSDNSDKSNKWRLPKVTLDPKEYLVIWTDKDEGQGDFHTNFKLSAVEEEIGIYHDESLGLDAIDFIAFVDQQPDEPIGRIDNGTGLWESAIIPTPGKSNLRIGEERMNVNIEIFPNPVSDQLQLRILNEEEENLNIRLLNALGQTVLAFDLDDYFYDTFIPVHKYAAGMYFIVVSLKYSDSIQVLNTKKIVVHNY